MNRHLGRALIHLGLRRPPPPPDPAVEPDSIARNTGYAFAAQLATATFTAGLVIFLVRKLGPENYGIFSLAIGIGALVVLPADFGLSSATARFIAEHGRRRGAAAAVMAEGLRLKILASAAVAALLLAVAEPIAEAYNEPELTWPLRGVAIAVFGQSMLAFYSTAFMALRRTSMNLKAMVGEGAVEAGASITLVLLGGGASGAAFGRAIGFVFGMLLAFALAYSLLGRSSVRRTPGESQVSARQIGRYAGILFIIDGAYTLFGQIDILIIGAVLSATSVGLFQAPMRLTALISYPGLALSAGIAPRLARRAGVRSEVGAFASGIRALIIFQALVVVPVIVWAEPITDLVLGPGYGESAEVLRALGPYVFLVGLAPLVTASVDYLGAARLRIPIAVGAVLINLVLDLILIPDIGIVGGAIGTDAAFLIYVPAHIWICNREVGLPLRRLGLTFLRAAIAAGVFTGVLFTIGTTDLSPVEWAAGLSGGAAAFAAVLFLTGELKPADLQRIRDLARRLRPGATVEP